MWRSSPSQNEVATSSPQTQTEKQARRKWQQQPKQEEQQSRAASKKSKLQNCDSIATGRATGPQKLSC